MGWGAGHTLAGGGVVPPATKGTVAVDVGTMAAASGATGQVTATHTDKTPPPSSRDLTHSHSSASLITKPENQGRLPNTQIKTHKTYRERATDEYVQSYLRGCPWFVASLWSNTAAEGSRWRGRGNINKAHISRVLLAVLTSRRHGACGGSEAVYQGKVVL